MDKAARVWVVGCSTGQEAYSLGMLLLEFAREAKFNLPIQIFATDVNEQVLAKARAEASTPRPRCGMSRPERLRRFFDEVPGGYRVNKMLRELCVFARARYRGQSPLLPDESPELPQSAHLSATGVAEPADAAVPFFPQARRIPLAGRFRGHRKFLQLVHPGEGEKHNKARISSGPVPAVRALYSPTRADSRKKSCRSSRTRSGKRPNLIPAGKSNACCSPATPPAGVVINGEMKVLQFRGEKLGPHPSDRLLGKPDVHLLKMLRDCLLVLARSAIQEAQKRVRMGAEGKCTGQAKWGL